MTKQTTVVVIGSLRVNPVSDNIIEYVLGFICRKTVHDFSFKPSPMKIV